MVKATQILTAAVVALAAVLTAESSVEAQGLSLTVRLRNDAKVPDYIAGDAKRVVSQIYERAGVHLLWVEGGAKITIILQAHEPVGKRRQSVDVMGFAPGTETRRGTVAFILTHRVDEVSAGYHAEKAEVLGAAIAHELGHLLLPYKSHSQTGLMRAVWNQRDFRSGQHGDLVFTADQAAQIHQSPVVTPQSFID